VGSQLAVVMLTTDCQTKVSLQRLFRYMNVYVLVGWCWGKCSANGSPSCFEAMIPRLWAWPKFE